MHHDYDKTGTIILKCSTDKMNQPVCCHQHFDVSTSIKSIELIHNFKHGALNLVITTNTIVKSCTSNRINFIKKHNACLLWTSHLQEKILGKWLISWKELPKFKRSGAFFTWNSSRTILAPSPTYFWTSSLPITLIKQASVLLATALARSVLPVPGGP